MTTGAADLSARPRRRFEVWGSPIEHSLSPLLHAAAYDRLGLPWTYGRRRVDESSFARELAALDSEVHGLSLTMPLKRAAFEKWRTGYSSALAIILFVTVFGAANIYVKTLNKVKQR